MRRALGFILVLVVVGLSALEVSPAAACTPKACLDGISFPVADSHIPGNAPAIAFEPSGPFGAATAPDRDEIVVRHVGGAIVPTKIAPDPASPGSYLVALPSLSPDLYSFERRVHCPAASPDLGSPVANTTFRVDADSALPTTIGILTLERSLEPASSSPSSGPCSGGAPVPSVVQHLALAKSPELSAYGPLARYELYVDGVLWGASRYGIDTPKYLALDRSTPFYVYAACGGLDAGATTRQSAAHRVRHGSLRAHVAGAATDPAPLEFDFELACDDVLAMPASDGCAFASRAPTVAPAIVFLLGIIVVRRRRTT